MIFKLKTSNKTAKIFEEIGRSTSLKPYILVKHAIAWSLRDGEGQLNLMMIQMAWNLIGKLLLGTMMYILRH